MPLQRPLAVLALLAFAGCADGSTASRVPGAAGQDVAENVDRGATPGAFGVCHGYGCHSHDIAGLSGQQWRHVLEVFKSPATSAKEERDRIAEAVGFVERAVGEQLGTKGDRPRAPMILIDSTQLDCVDESTNTSTTLHMLNNAGLLRWHTVGEPTPRGTVLLLNIHFTAVVIEKETRMPYAIDSWFYANGVPPVIVPLATWQRGYDPDKVPVVQH